jgi:hypothetical protein
MSHLLAEVFKACSIRSASPLLCCLAASLLLRCLMIQSLAPTMPPTSTLTSLLCYACTVQGHSAGPAGPVVTVCVPPGLETEALHTVRPLYLILHEMEKYLNAPFPFPQLSLVFVPPAAFTGRPSSERIATGAGIILVGGWQCNRRKSAWYAAKSVLSCGW